MPEHITLTQQASISLIDLAALVWFIIAWMGYTIFAEYMRTHKDNSLLTAMNKYRLDWMRNMLKRENRMVDATSIGNLLRSISFFASTSILILIGLVTALGYRDEAIQMLESLPFTVKTGHFMFEMKLGLLAMVFIYGFFKFTWSLRQYNYATIMVGAAPMHNEETERHDAYARRLARLIANAARHFSMGLRAYYFGMALLAWFFHPWLFIAASAWVLMVLYRREFKSKALRYITTDINVNEP